VMGQVVFNYRTGYDTTIGEEISRYFPHARPPGTFAASLSGAMGTLVHHVMDQYKPILAGKPLSDITWPRELFPHFDPSCKFFARVIDLTGPARFLTWGPYMCLPHGEWIVTIEIEVTENHSGNGLQVDVLAGTDRLTSVRTDLPARGVFSFDMQFPIVEPQRPIEIRSFLLFGAIEGQFALRRARVRSASNRLIESEAVPKRTDMESHRNKL
jgi:hypothetical protein